jgi:serine/threonine-protein kinase
MAEVRGRTLTTVIHEVHQASRTGPWQAGPSGWTFRRLVDAFLKACEAVAYAHDRGVVHRDLKPANIMVGNFGEVMVVDWGLAKVVSREEDRTVTTTVNRARTMPGTVMGTLSYMPPEQARGEIGLLGPRSDVYALGAILHHILSGRKPRAGLSPLQTLADLESNELAPPCRQVLDGQQDESLFALSDQGQADFTFPALPEELVATCVRATSHDLEDRFTDAGQLATEIAAWLDGARRRDRALEVVNRAEELAPRAGALRQQAEELRSEATRLLAQVAAHQPEADKAEAWSVEDQAVSLERQADRLSLEQEQLLAAALTHAPELPEAHAALAIRRRAVHQSAEATRDAAATARSEVKLRAHVEALPSDHPVRVDCATYLTGDGALTLHTDPPGAEVLLHRYEPRHRRLVAVFERSLGPTPLAQVPLPMGSYLCVLRSEGRPDTRYPVHVGRGEHWNGTPPGATEPLPVRLPSFEELGPDDVHVPTGWFLSGGDPESTFPLPHRRLWTPGLVFRRFPVTNRDYIAFLDDLVATGHEEEAVLHVPRERAGQVGELGAMLYGRTSEGRFELVVDTDGDPWLPNWPVMMLNLGGARAYAAWEAQRRGQPWRLPGELEWEKAARGVDGRFFPWGDFLDPSWCCMLDSQSDRPLPQVIDSFPVDESPYGLRGMGGNTRDWCDNRFTSEAPEIFADRAGAQDACDVTRHGFGAVRGGNWCNHAHHARCASRGRLEPDNRNTIVGFRLARTLHGHGSDST